MSADGLIEKLALGGRPSWRRLLVVALVCAATGLLLRAALTPLLAGAPGYILLAPLVVLAAVAAGLAAGVLTACLCLLAVALGPVLWGEALGLPNAAATGAGASFAVVALLLSLLGAALRAALGQQRRLFEQLALSEGRVAEGEAQIVLLSEQAPTMLWMSTPEGACAHLNPELRAFWGVDGPLQAFDFTQTIHPDDRPHVVAILTEAAKAAKPFEVEARYRRHDGEWRVLETRARPRLDAEGRFLGMIGVNVDVTERRAAEARFRTAISAVSGTLWTNSPEGRMEGEQPGWAALTGQSQNEYQGFGWAEAVHPDDAQPTVQAWNAAVAERRTFEFEHRLKTCDGDWRTFAIRAVPTLENGEVVEWVGVHTDVTEQRQAEAALRESEARFRLVADNIPNLAWMAEPDGAIYWYNKRWYDYTGTTLEEMQGWGWQAVHDPDHVDQVVETFKHSIETGEAWEHIFPLRRHDGAWGWFLSRAQPVRDGEGRIIRWFGTNTEITEQRQAEASLRESETRFRLLADTAPSPVWMTNAEAEVEFVNQALVEFYGKPADQLTGHTWRDRLHPDDLPDMLAIQAEARPEQKPYGFETRFQRKDGVWRWMRVSVNPRFDADGTFKGYVGLSFDITETRDALDALERQERRQRLLLELSDRVRDLTEPGTVMLEISRLLGEALDIDRVGYGEIDPAVETITVRDTWVQRGMPAISGTWRMDDFGPELIRLYRAGHSAAVDDVTQDPRTVEIAAAFASIDTQTVAAAPVMRGGAMQALIFAHGPQPRRWTAEDLELMDAVANRAWAEVERARAESSVRESEERFRAIADTAPVLIWVTARDRTREFVNQAYVAYMGGEYDAVRQADWRDFIHPDDQQRLMAESLAGEATLKPFSLEARYLRHDGKYRWLKSFSRPRVAEDGELLGFVGVAFDVTDIREAQARLEESETRFRTVADSAPALIWMMDEELRPVFANRRYRTFFDIESEDQMVEGWMRLVDPEENDVFNQTFQAAWEKRERFDRLIRLNHPSLGERWLRCEGLPRFDVDGAFKGFVGANLDITEAKQAEVRLQESETRFRTVADSAPALIYMIDTEGQVVFANRRYKTFFDVEAEEMLGDGWRAIVHPDDVDDFHAAFNQAFAARDRFERLVRVVHPSMGVRWLRCEAIPRFSSEGEFTGYVGANLDVTEAKKAEQDLKRINELLEERVGDALAEKAKAEADLMHAQRMEAVGRLTGGVAHDFNNLLTVVIGALDIILRSPDDAAKRKRLGEAALSAARRGERLTHQLLAFSRRQALRPEPVDLNALIAESEPLLRRAVGEAVEFELRLTPEPTRVNVDAAQFEAALLNLVVNARDAMGETGRVDITTEQVEVTAGEVVDLTPGRYVRVSVTDSGEGMTPEIIDRVFEPFFTTKPVGKGTGLGLSQVYGFTRQSGGGAKISSEPGLGAKISLYLPPLESAVAEPEAAEAAQGPDRVSGRRVLLVEDDEAVAEIAADILRDMGMLVVSAASGPEALERLKGETFDLMLTDVVMPGGMTGVELSRQCARLYPDMRIILASGYVGDDVEAQLKDATWPFLRKPYSADELRAVLGGVDT